jgi:ABC-2 type transport system ATP-binding protein
MHLRVCELTKRYGRRRALDNVSLDIAPGQIVAVLGLNGAGKSTLLNCFAGLTAPDSGQVLFDGIELNREDLAMRRRFYHLPDFPLLFDHGPVLRNLSIILRLYEADGPGTEDKVLALLEEFDVLPLAFAPAGILSRGQRYKVALVALLAVDPEIWFFDEPLASGMDPLGLSAFRRHARSAAERGRTIIYSTQLVEAAEKLCHRAIILHDGRVQGFDTLERLSPTEESGGSNLGELFVRLRDDSQA